MWNVRTFNSQVKVGDDGNVRIEGSDPEKPRVFCDTLKNAGISLCCISEVRWRGTGSIHVNDHLILYSGLPDTDTRAEQGVGIVLDEEMQRAWKRADQFCETQGSRLMRIKLILNKRTINVISVYAPTYNTEAVHKDRFYQQLHDMIQKVGSTEEVFVFGDFNARVARSTDDVDMSTADADDQLIVGPFGLQETNDNGERLLGLCAGAMNQPLRVMSTFFQHAHYGTWFHNSSRRWFQIDHCLAARRSARFVMDVATKPGIGFDTDHRLVKVK